MAKVTTAFAPGRVELLGNHTDYNEGLVLGAAIDRGLTVSGSGRDDGVIELKSNLLGQARIALANPRPQADVSWANYVVGVAHELIGSGVPIKGFEARMEGNLPMRTGLSSSAALEVAVALFLLKLHQRKLDPIELAKLCQRAEHRFVGVHSGLLDQVMSIFGRVNQLICFDARSEEVRMISFPAGLALIIVDSGRQRQLAQGDYNLRRKETATAARMLGVHALRDVSLCDLDARTNIDPVLCRRARHIVGENERVQRAIELLEDGNVGKFGQLMNESHESSRQNFENSTPELDLLVQLAQSICGVLGARLTGGGFGGSIVALCQRDHANEAMRHLRDAYRKQTGISPEIFICQVSDGAQYSGSELTP
ncbi:MAG TPA: galactokinase [Chthoniobacterales bacterium]|jgi:galactokinase